jgi:hypothetical protein
MNKKNLLILFLFFVSAMLPALGNRESTPTVRVTGIVRLVGTSLFPELIISNSDYIWYIAAEEINKLRDLQHRTVTVEAEETITELQFANGMSAGIRRELRNVRIILIEAFQN